jgi:hypothetical protein
MSHQYQHVFKSTFSTSILAWIFLLFLILVSVEAKLSAQSDTIVQPQKFGSYTPNQGFRLVTSDKGVLNFRIWTYLRYLNQKGLDSVYVDSFGDSTTLDLRQDLQINKVNIQFNGWILDPKFKFFLYTWTNNTSQGDGAQVVVAGNLNYQFSKYLTVGAGIEALPGVRSTEGTFPFWLTVDNRLVADEFFRGSFTTGIWAKGSLTDKLTYNVMLGNNLSQLGVNAAQLDNSFNTFAGALVYYPTTGEYGLKSSFGDFDHHEKIATRVGAHYSRSDENRQEVPNTDVFENVTLRLSDGSVIFKPGLFAPGTQVDDARYQMASFDGGVKYLGFALEGEYYLRRIDNFRGRGTIAIPVQKLLDNGFQLQASAMVVDKILQLYGTYSSINGEYGNPSEYRAGVNWFVYKNQVVRWNFEFIHETNNPVGGLSLPYQVGGNGNIFHSDFQVNF